MATFHPAVLTVTTPLVPHLLSCCCPAIRPPCLLISHCELQLSAYCFSSASILFHIDLFFPCLSSNLEMISVTSQSLILQTIRDQTEGITAHIPFTCEKSRSIWFALGWHFPLILNLSLTAFFPFTFFNAGILLAPHCLLSDWELILTEGGQRINILFLRLVQQGLFGWRWNVS